MHSYCRCNQLGLVLLFATRCHFSIKLKPALEEEASQGLPVVINYDWQVVPCTRPLTGYPPVSAILTVAADQDSHLPPMSHSTVSTTIYLSSISNIQFIVGGFRGHTPPPPPFMLPDHATYMYICFIITLYTHLLLKYPSVIEHITNIFIGAVVCYMEHTPLDILDHLFSKFWGNHYSLLKCSEQHYFFSIFPR